MRSADITCIEAPRTKQNRESGGLLVWSICCLAWSSGHDSRFATFDANTMLYGSPSTFGYKFGTEIVGLLGVHHFKPTASTRLTSDVTLWYVQGRSCCYARRRWNLVVIWCFLAGGIGCVKPAGWQLWWKINLRSNHNEEWWKEVIVSVGPVGCFQIVMYRNGSKTSNSWFFSLNQRVVSAFRWRYTVHHPKMNMVFLASNSAPESEWFKLWRL